MARSCFIEGTCVSTSARLPYVLVDMHSQVGVEQTSREMRVRQSSPWIKEIFISYPHAQMSLYQRSSPRKVYVKKYSQGDTSVVD